MHFKRGAENGTRTRDLNLGKVALYQLSYFRIRVGLFPNAECKGRRKNLICKNFLALSAKKMSPLWSDEGECARHSHIHAGGELREKTHVVLEIVSQVVHLPFKHGYTFDSHSEGESAVLLTVYA